MKNRFKFGNYFSVSTFKIAFQLLKCVIFSHDINFENSVDFSQKLITELILC